MDATCVSLPLSRNLSLSSSQNQIPPSTHPPQTISLVSGHTSRAHAVLMLTSTHFFLKSSCRPAVVYRVHSCDRRKGSCSHVGFSMVLLFIFPSFSEVFSPRPKVSLLWSGGFAASLFPVPVLFPFTVPLFKGPSWRAQFPAPSLFFFFTMFPKVLPPLGVSSLPVPRPALLQPADSCSRDTRPPPPH